VTGHEFAVWWSGLIEEAITDGFSGGHLNCESATEARSVVGMTGIARSLAAEREPHLRFTVSRSGLVVFVAVDCLEDESR